MKSKTKILIVIFLLSSCNASNTRVDRLNEYEKSIKKMSCKELKSDLTFQKDILKGLKKRQKNKVTLADVGITALSLGINVIENSVNKNSRNLRLEEIEQKIDMLNLTIKNKGC
jgi:hypothetical protein